MASALAAYLVYQEARLKPLSLVQVKRHLLKHCRSLHAMQMAKLDRRTVSSRIAAVAAKSGPVEANRVRSSLAAFFQWAIWEGLADVNPAAGGSKAPEKSRDRVLDVAELREIWNATADDRDYSAIVRLVMLTGCRIAEIGGLRWAEIDGDCIVLPADRTKNSRAIPSRSRQPFAKFSTVAAAGPIGTLFSGECADFPRGQRVRRRSTRS